MLALVDKGSSCLYFDLSKPEYSNPKLLLNIDIGISTIKELDLFELRIDLTIDKTDRIKIENYNHIMEEIGECIIIVKPQRLIFASEYTYSDVLNENFPCFKKMDGKFVANELYKLRGVFISIIPVTKLVKVNKSMLTDHVKKGINLTLEQFFKTLNIEEEDTVC